MEKQNESIRNLENTYNFFAPITQMIGTGNLMSWNSHITKRTIWLPNIPLAEERIGELTRVRKEASVAHEMAR